MGRLGLAPPLPTKCPSAEARQLVADRSRAVIEVATSANFDHSCVFKHGWFGCRNSNHAVSEEIWK